jgi:hypothetical protein
VARVSVAAGTADGTWLIRVARGQKTGKLTAGNVYGPYAALELEARFAQVVATLKAEGFDVSNGQLLVGQLSAKSGKQRARAAQRLGWMRAKDAVLPLIAALESAGDDACTLIDALGEIGDARAVPVLREFAERKLLSRRRSAVEALRKLGDAPGLADARTRALERLPDAVKAVVVALDAQAGSDPTPLVKAVLAVPLKERGLALDSLYELDDRLCVLAVRDVLEQSQLNAPHLWRYTKSIFKRALLRGDVRTFGWLQHLIEVRGQVAPGTRAKVKSGYDGKEHDVLIFGRRTQAFIKRLAWRWLRKLARWRPERYAAAAAEAVVNYHPSNARPARGLYGAWAQAYVLHRVLRGRSHRFVYGSRTLRFRFRFRSQASVVAPAPSVREEPFPELWDAQPNAYLRLLAAAKLSDVQRFAAAGLERHPGLLQKASGEDLRLMLNAPFEGTVEAALAELGRRFDASRPDWVLLRGLLDDERDVARELGLQWLKLTSHVWTRDVTQSLAFLEAKAPDVRVLAASMLVLSLPGAPAAHRQAFADAVLARLQQPEVTSGDHDRYARVATEALSAELLTRFSLDQLMQLIATGSVSVKAIAGGLLARRPGSFEALTLERVLPLADADVAAVRAASLTLLEGALPFFRGDPTVLFALAESRWADVRTGAVKLLRAAEVGRLGLEGLIGLCDSNHEEVQELGKALVLQHLGELDPQELLFRLSQHPGRNVRRFALDLVEKHLKDGFVSLARLELFFRAALMDLSPDRAMKRRVLQLLATRGVRDENQAEMAASILKDFVHTAVKNDFELATTALISIQLAFPTLDTGLKVRT